MPKNLIGDSLDAIQKLTEEKTGKTIETEKIDQEYILLDLIRYSGINPKKNIEERLVQIQKIFDIKILNNICMETNNDISNTIGKIVSEKNAINNNLYSYFSFYFPSAKFRKLSAIHCPEIKIQVSPAFSFALY